jgi:hypothetical protein
MASQRVLLDSETAILAMLSVDLELALTFSQIAAAAHAEVKRTRNIQNAEKAYFAALEWLDRLKTSPEEHPDISRKLTLLRTALVSLGVVSVTKSDKKF